MSVIGGIAVPRQRASAPNGAHDLTIVRDETSWQSAYIARVLVTDVVAASVAGLLAFSVRFGGDTAATSGVDYAWVSVLLPLGWLAVVGITRAYESRFLGTGSEEFRRVFHAGLLLTSGIAVYSYATQAEIARGYVVLALPSATGLSLLGRYLLRTHLHRRRRRGECLHRVLVVGHEAGVTALVRQVRREPHSGMHIVAACLPDGGQRSELLELNVAVAGDFTGIVAAAQLVGADTVAVMPGPEMDAPALRRLSWELQDTGLDLVVAPSLLEVAGPRIHIRPVSGLPLLHVEQPQLSGGRKLAKGLVDRLLAGAALLLLAPLLLSVAVMVRLTSSGPALFRQTRIGRGGREFTMWKFRTMVVDAEQRLTELAHLNKNSDGVLFKLARDPRITRVGGLLRRWSIDELPQLLNVVRGDMSLVGPRPPLPSEVERYGDDMRRRLLVKPGLTGLWQVSGRSDLSWDDAVRLDLRYVENWTLTMDALILWKTAAAVVRGSGAY